MQNETWHTLSDASRKLSISEITLRRRIKSGKIQAKLEHGKYFLKLPKEEKHGDTKENGKSFSKVQDSNKNDTFPKNNTFPHLKTVSQSESSSEPPETLGFRQSQLKRKVLNQSCLIKFLEELLLKYRKV
jgi:hypothetical protein